MLRMEVNGNVYKDAINISVTRSVNNFCGYFEASSSLNVENLLPLKLGDAITVLADEKLIFNGYIEQLQVQYDSESHEISIAGRDRVCDALDSTVTGDKVFKGPTNLKSVLRAVLDAGGMSAIGIIDEAGGIPDFGDGDTVEAEVGQTIFEFLEPYARKLQVIMTSNEDGDILLMRAGTVHSGLSLVNGENILQASLKKTDDKRFNKYIAKSALNPISNDDADPVDVVSQSGTTATDSDIRSTRVKEFNTEEDMDNDTSFNRANFEANIRRSNSLNYSCVVQGHSINDMPFKINTIATVSDGFADIGGDLLIHTIEYKYSLNGGSLSVFQMTYKDAYTLQAQQSARDAARQLTAGAF